MAACWACMSRARRLAWMPPMRLPTPLRIISVFWALEKFCAAASCGSEEPATRVAVTAIRAVRVIGASLGEGWFGRGGRPELTGPRLTPPFTESRPPPGARTLKKVQKAGPHPERRSAQVAGRVLASPAVRGAAAASRRAHPATHQRGSRVPQSRAFGGRHAGRVRASRRAASGAGRTGMTRRVNGGHDAAGTRRSPTVVGAVTGPRNG